MSDNKEVWKPLSVSEIQDIFNKIPIQWWIAGGWALDLYLERTTREHGDIDTLILRSEHLILQKYLYGDWEMYKAFKGQLIPWRLKEKLDSQFDNIWVKKKGETTWAFQIMILDSEEEHWIYKRNGKIRMLLKDIGLESSSGVPYLRPEIQLLYKGGSSVIREKDVIDLKNVLPKLSDTNRDWLKDSLNIQYQNGHQWIEIINSYVKNNLRTESP
ncbi:MAG: nucleotidyltransferase domain-containing protein [Bacillota bacterium]|uniref:nucleotidyltransferase domain-containing protein n=1 Tax=Cytobacillus firmus TaxID=1399 RepID=UPI0036B390CE